MSQHNLSKIRKCLQCGERAMFTAKELKGHAKDCGKKAKKAA